MSDCAALATMKCCAATNCDNQLPKGENGAQASDRRPAVAFGTTRGACHCERRTRLSFSVLFASLTAFGGMIEVLQWRLRLGRDADWTDFAAGVLAISLILVVGRYLFSEHEFGRFR
jgi:hypothetical protein